MNKSQIRVFFRPGSGQKYRPYFWLKRHLKDKPLLKSYSVEVLKL
jgi:hypothetical protein